VKTNDRTPQLLIAKEDLPKYVGLNRAQIDRLRRDETSDFPQPIRVGARRLMWAEEEIYEWQQKLLKARPKRQAAA